LRDKIIKLAKLFYLKK